MMQTILCTNLNRMAYEEAYNLQFNLMKAMDENPEMAGFLLFVEHPPTYTFGVSTLDEDILLDREALTQMGFCLYDSNRGGSVTYHGPGQQVVYPILNLTHFSKDVRWYVNNLEEWVIKTLYQYDLNCGRKEGYRGVWIDDEKICAVGVAVKRWKTMHGIGLNNQPNMDHFRNICPCGIKEFGVTSIQEKGKFVPGYELTMHLIEEFEKTFNCSIQLVAPEEVNNIANQNSKT